jgi:hypothetical protein
MWRIAFASLWLAPAAGLSQSRLIPGRDLLEFPVGLAAESSALGDQTGMGLWNPATALLPPGARWRLAAASMSAPADVAVSAQAGSVAGSWRGSTFAFTVARAAVAGLSRTESDPQSIGDDVEYSTIVVSAIAASRLSSHVVAGVALRSRTGRLDDIKRTGVALDAGFIADHLGDRDVRLGASTFLFSPVGGNRDRPAYAVGADVRVVGPDSAHAVRAGYDARLTPGLSTEQFLFAEGRWGRWEIRGGPAHTEIYGAGSWRLRLGLAVHHAGYAIGVAREESANGIAATYQFTLSSVLK